MSYSYKKRISLNPSQTDITRTPVGSTSMRFSMGGPQSTIIKRTNIQSSYASMPLMPSGEVSNLSKQSVAGVVAERAKDKRTLTELNDKFIKYIDSVKYLETQNKCMQEELENLRKMKGYTQEKVRELYEEEMADARETIKTQAAQIAPLTAEKLSLMDKVESLLAELAAQKSNNKELMKAKNQLTSVVGDLEGENRGLRESLNANEQDMDMLEAELKRSCDDNDRIRGDLDAAITKQINLSNELDALKAEFELCRASLLAEIEELTDLLANFKSLQPSFEKHWKNNFGEMCKALKDDYEKRQAISEANMQHRYDEQIRIIKSNVNRDDSDSQITKSENKTLKSQFGNVKLDLQRLRDDNDRLQRELESLRITYQDECDECEREKNELRMQYRQKDDELNDVNANLAELQNSKLTLEVEIACYRKLLECEENSMKTIIQDQTRMQSEGGAALAGIISGGGGGSSSMSMSMSGGGGGSGGGHSVSQQSNPDISKAVNTKPGSGKPQKKTPENGMSESTGTVRISKKTKCSVNIIEVALDGSYVKLENTSKKFDADLGNWTLVNKKPKKGIDGSSYKFAAGFKIGAGESIRIFSQKFKSDAEYSSDLLATKDCPTWSPGDGLFVLKDVDGIDKAECTITFGKQ